MAESPGDIPPPSPPPPGRAEKLVAQSGFVVYEGGNSVFDESLLVYIARPHKQWPDFDVCDHVGRPLAYSRSERRSSMFKRRNPVVYYDQRMNQILHIRSTMGGFSMAFEVSGVANCRVSGGPTRMGRLVIEANNEQYGTIIGSRMRGMLASSIEIVDDRENRIAAIRSFGDGGLFSKVWHYVMSIEPGLRGELRRTLVGVPSIIATVRSQQQAS